MSDLEIQEHYTAPADGWSLHLKRTRSPRHFRPDTRPLVIVPGYGMNAFIFGFHPRGTSMERCLAEAGHEVWSVNLRHQGPSRSLGARPAPPSLRAWAEADLRRAVDRILEVTHTRAGKVVLVGCSLGGSIAYAHLALVRDHRVGGLVTIGAPLRWTEVHPVLKVAFASPRVAGALKLRGTRRLARMALPYLRNAPWLLSIYMNARHVDLSAAAEMARTVDDPHPQVNREIAEWIGARDLVFGGVNVTEAMRRVDVPLLIVSSNRDGIVPKSATLSPVAVWGGRDVEVLHVGDDEHWFAHADLFIADTSPDKVFAPIARWADRLQ